MRRKYCVICLISGLALLVPVGAQETVPSKEFLGPFAASPTVSLYLAASSAPDATAWIKVLPDGKSPNKGRIMVRAFDPEERLLLRNYFETGRNNPPDAPEHRSWQIPLKDAGVYQVRLTAEQSSPRATVSVQIPPGTEYGVSFQNGVYRNWPGQPSTMYAYVPPKAEELLVTGGPLRIFDEAGKELYASDSDKVSFKDAVRIPVTRTDVVWRVEFPRPENWRFQAARFPFLLCPTEVAARTIRASVEVLPDGTVVAHKFQRRIAEIIPDLLSPESVGSTEELAKLAGHLGEHPEQWLADPLRNQLLLGSFFPSVEWSLRNQNLDPQSHWSGSIGLLWQEYETAAPPKNRWDRFGSFEGVPATTEGLGGEPRVLAEVALLDVPFNPWFGKKELLNRAAASALRDLMVLGEDEVWPMYQTSLYPGGGLVFYAAGKFFAIYEMVSPRMPENIREAWTDGLRHIADRYVTSPLLGTRNQSAHYLSVYQDFAEGSNDPFDRRQAESFAHRFVEGQSSAGYFMEAGGPCGSYNGLTHIHMGLYYRATGDPAIREALRKSYRFFNHTVAPEPDGRLLGGFNFNHRIGTPFPEEQSGGAKGVADSIPEIGFRAPYGEAARAAAHKNIEQNVKNFPSAPRLGWYRLFRYLNWEEPDRNYVLPAQEPESFERNFANELLAVKRPAYYVVVYAAAPSSSKTVNNGYIGLREPLPNDAENKGGKVKANPNNIVPFVGGGLSLFWTPAYGASLLAANWSPLTHHGLVGITPDKKRWWEDYGETRADFGSLPEKFVVRGKLHQQPLAYERSYVFHDEYLETELVLTAEADLSLEHLLEVIPLASGGAKTDGAKVSLIEEGSGAKIRDTNGNGVDFVLETPAEIVVVENGLKSESLKLQIPRIEIKLPAHMKKEETFRLKYRLVPVTAGPKSLQ